MENMDSVAIEVYKHKWKFARAANVLGTRSSPKLPRVFLLNNHTEKSVVNNVIVSVQVF